MKRDIDSYEFGKMVINGKPYTNDVIITPSGVKSNWWRKEGHKLQLLDIEEVLIDGIEVLVVGAGAAGCMEVLREVYEKAKELNIEIISLPTTQAVAKFNSLLKTKKSLIGAFHLTC